MAFIDDGFNNASPFLPNASNFLASDPNTFLFDPETEWMDMSGWKTFWMSTFAPKKYKKKRDQEVAEGIKSKHKFSSSSSCSTLNSKIDNMESELDSNAQGGGGRGARRMQARSMKALEPLLDKAYNYADDKCCEGSVCAIKKTMGRGDDLDDGENGGNGGGSYDRGQGGSSLSSREQIKAELMAEMRSDPILMGYQTPPPPEAQAKEGMGMGTKLGLGMGGLLILMMMGYMVFKGGAKETSGGRSRGRR